MLAIIAIFLLLGAGKRRLLFVNKKKQKNFVHLSRACFSVTF